MRETSLTELPPTPVDSALSLNIPFLDSEPSFSPALDSFLSPKSSHEGPPDKVRVSANINIITTTNTASRFQGNSKRPTDNGLTKTPPSISSLVSMSNSSSSERNTNAVENRYPIINSKFNNNDDDDDDDDSLYSSHQPLSYRRKVKAPDPIMLSTTSKQTRPNIAPSSSINKRRESSYAKLHPQASSSSSHPNFDGLPNRKRQSQRYNPGNYSRDIFFFSSSSQPPQAGPTVSYTSQRQPSAPPIPEIIY